MVDDKNRIQTLTSLAQTLIALIVVFYIASAGVMTAYYTYKDIKSHEGFLRASLWSPLVGTVKGAVWPYHVFFKEDDGGMPPP